VREIAAQLNLTEETTSRQLQRVPQLRNDARRHQLVVTLPPQAVRVEPDATHLTQVFANLLNNATRTMRSQ